MLSLTFKMKYLILFTMCAMWIREQPTDPVLVRGGALRGVISNDGVYAQYLGIPYARTDREHRFQAPLPVQPWDGVYDAVEENVRCPQRMSHYLLGQEDCLKLNVYTPLGHSSQPLPVMIYFHGGGFFEGSGLPTIYGPDYFMNKGVVLVTMNYRLNIQGFLCLRIPEAPGNAGLKDQVAGLKWVQENIRAFGGNPDDVTVFGESAGAVSISYHILSPMSKGLFHKAILQSGSSLSGFSHQYDPVYLASLLSTTMGYKTKDPLELYQIFMNKTDEELVLTRVPREKGNTVISEVLFTPCVEKIIPGVEAFLTDNPYNLLSKGEYNKVPLIIGYNSEEGLMLAGVENDTTLENMTFEKSLPKNLEFPTETERKEAAAKFQRLYLGNTKISMENLVNVSRIYGEPYFNYPGAKETELLLETSDQPVYNYKFSYNGYLNVPKRFSGFAKVQGATHADDLFYLFKPRILISPYRYLEWDMIQKITTLWANFAKFGKPTPVTSALLPVQWKPTEKDSPHVLVIDQQFTTEPLWKGESLLLWRDIYERFRRKEKVN